ncbi:hypothetical protein VNO77_38988 [Canavalia gladiata]|uniref:Uncharacterized protein n=1 Tax=Canavalia gladiata TaxID=3824 RepID=A0AAN9PXC7_CANGL
MGKTKLGLVEMKLSLERPNLERSIMLHSYPSWVSLIQHGPYDMGVQQHAAHSLLAIYLEEYGCLALSSHMHTGRARMWVIQCYDLYPIIQLSKSRRGQAKFCLEQKLLERPHIGKIEVFRENGFGWGSNPESLA